MANPTGAIAKAVLWRMAGWLAAWEAVHGLHKLATDTNGAKGEPKTILKSALETIDITQNVDTFVAGQKFIHNFIIPALALWTPKATRLFLRIPSSLAFQTLLIGLPMGALAVWLNADSNSEKADSRLKNPLTFMATSVKAGVPHFVWAAAPLVGVSILKRWHRPILDPFFAFLSRPFGKLTTSWRGGQLEIESGKSVAALAKGWMQNHQIGSWIKEAGAATAGPTMMGLSRIQSANACEAIADGHRFKVRDLSLIMEGYHSRRMDEVPPDWIDKVTVKPLSSKPSRP